MGRLHLFDTLTPGQETKIKNYYSSRAVNPKGKYK